MENDEKVVIERRKFLSKLMLGGFALVGASSLFVAAGFLYPVSVKKPEPRFVCLVDQIPPDKPLEIEDPFGRKVLLMRRDDGELMAISTVCIHLGCMVFFRPQTKVFECPCHQGFFDYDGNPISGPPQTPLERYPVSVRDRMVFIQFSQGGAL